VASGSTSSSSRSAGSVAQASTSEAKDKCRVGAGGGVRQLGRARGWNSGDDGRLMGATGSAVGGKVAAQGACERSGSDVTAAWDEGGQLLVPPTDGCGGSLSPADARGTLPSGSECCARSRQFGGHTSEVPSAGRSESHAPPDSFGAWSQLAKVLEARGLLTDLHREILREVAGAADWQERASDFYSLGAARILFTTLRNLARGVAEQVVADAMEAANSLQECWAAVALSEEVTQALGACRADHPPPCAPEAPGSLALPADVVRAASAVAACVPSRVTVAQPTPVGACARRRQRCQAATRLQSAVRRQAAVRLRAGMCARRQRRLSATSHPRT
jgi:hypothetical protein